jgi:hypothetical protein
MISAALISALIVQLELCKMVNELWCTVRILFSLSGPFQAGTLAKLKRYADGSLSMILEDYWLGSTGIIAIINVFLLLIIAALTWMAGPPEITMFHRDAQRAELTSIPKIARQTVPTDTAVDETPRPSAPADPLPDLDQGTTSTVTKATSMKPSRRIVKTTQINPDGSRTVTVREEYI